MARQLPLPPVKLLRISLHRSSTSNQRVMPSKRPFHKSLQPLRKRQLVRRTDSLSPRPEEAMMVEGLADSSSIHDSRTPRDACWWMSGGMIGEEMIAVMTVGMTGEVMVGGR